MLQNKHFYYLSLSSYTLLTKPHSLASEANIFLAVNTNSRTRLSLPIMRGNLCNVPTSAAIPVQKDKSNYTHHTVLSPSKQAKKSTIYLTSVIPPAIHHRFLY